MIKLYFLKKKIIFLTIVYRNLFSCGILNTIVLNIQKLIRYQNLGGKTVKSFSISKLSTALVISILAVSLVGCSTTSTKVEESATETPVVTQPETTAVTEAMAPVQETVTTEEPVVAEEEVVAPVEEVVAEEEVVAPVEEVVAPVEEVVAPVEEVVAPVEEAPVEYPLGIEPIVKSDADFNSFDLFFVYTGDVEGTFNASETSVGYSRLSTMLQVGRSITDNILVLDAGNALSGSLVANETQGVAAGSLLYMLNYDAIAPQAGEYAFGEKALFSASSLAKEQSSLKVLSANTLDADAYLPFQPYQLYDFNGFTVCVVGLTSPVANVTDLTFDSDIVLQNAQLAVDTARQYADYVVVLGSMDKVSSKFICENINGIDLFIDGSNSAVESGTIVNGATIVSAGANMSSVGVVDVLVKDGTVSVVSPFQISAADVNDPANSALAAAYGITSIPEDSNVAAFIASEEAQVNDKLSAPVATAAKTYANDDASKKQTKLGSFVSAATTKATYANASILSSGLLAQAIEAGEVSTLDLNATVPSDSNAIVTEMTGAQIYAALEAAYASLPEGSDTFVQSDLKVIYNKYAKAGSRVLRVKLGNTNIDKDATYTIATDMNLVNAEGFDMGTKVGSGDSFTTIIIDALNN